MSLVNIPGRLEVFDAGYRDSIDDAICHLQRGTSDKIIIEIERLLYDYRNLVSRIIKYEKVK